MCCQKRSSSPIPVLWALASSAIAGGGTIYPDIEAEIRSVETNRQGK
jgi:hypothetical protein